MLKHFLNNHSTHTSYREGLGISPISQQYDPFGRLVDAHDVIDYIPCHAPVDILCDYSSLLERTYDTVPYDQHGIAFSCPVSHLCVFGSRYDSSAVYALCFFHTIDVDIPFCHSFRIPLIVNYSTLYKLSQIPSHAWTGEL